MKYELSYFASYWVTPILSKTTCNWLALKQMFSELTNPVKPAPFSSRLLELEFKKKKIWENSYPDITALGVKHQVTYFQKLIQQELYTLFQGTTRSCR